MRQKTLKFLEDHIASSEATFEQEAQWRQENELWLKWSRGVAMHIVDYMQEKSLSRSGLAEMLGCSPQYVSRVLSGRENFSLKTIADMERTLGVPLLETEPA